MVTFSREIKQVVKVQETCLFHRRFPRRLKCELCKKVPLNSFFNL